MSLEKVLHKMQMQINELAPTLELFVEDTIQPSVNHCEKLQQQLTELQENLAVYKYNKINKEISPSFSLHAKISEIETPLPNKETQAQAVIIQEKENQKTEEITNEFIQEIIIEQKSQATSFTIGINDKFRFINELFKQNNSEYNIAIEQLGALKTWEDSEIYLNSLKSLYNWNDNNEVAIFFYSITKKRFS